MWRDSESDQDFLNFTEVADQIAVLATSADLLPVSIGVFGTCGTGKSTVLRLVENALLTAAPKPIIITRSISDAGNSLSSIIQIARI